ncbi:MAG: hypothetical protein DRP70_09915, partial [Spirochaetes bacterium]
LKERLDLLEHSGKDSLGERWNIINPWDLYSAEWNLGVYIVNGSSSLPMHAGAEETLALFFSDLLDILPDMKLPLDKSERNLEIKTVSSFADAFRMSREKLDYFVLVNFTETSRTFSASAELFLAGTGESIGRFDEMRTGQGMVSDTLHTLSLSLSAALPRIMSIVSVDGDRVLLDKGRWQGITKDKDWIVLRKDAGQPANVDAGLVYSSEDFLGTVKVGELSEPLSEGIYTAAGDFNFISPGDELFLLPVPEINKDSLNTPDPAFKARLLAIP